MPAPYIDSWHVEGRRNDGYVITCYGIKTEGEAIVVAADIRAMPGVASVAIIHTSRKTKRSRWIREIRDI